MTAARLGWHLTQACCVTYVTICATAWLYTYGLAYLKTKAA